MSTSILSFWKSIVRVRPFPFTQMDTLVSQSYKRRRSEKAAENQNTQNLAVSEKVENKRQPTLTSFLIQPQPQEFVFKEKEGDLFNCPPSWSLAHCISVDAHMGKGIATIFKKNFKGVDEIKRQGSEIGGCAVLKRDERFIYYLTTKARYFEKPSYESLHSSLETMKKHCIENEVKYVAMPMIGCGLDGLWWPRVNDMIREVFQDTTLTITVYKLGKRAPSNKRACFSKPTMENSYRKLVS